MDDTTRTVSTTNNNKWLYISVGAVVVFIVLGFLMRNAGYMAARANGVKVQPAMDGSATYSTDEGSVTVGSNKMPDNWPSDAPGNFTGAQVQYAGTSNPQTGSAGSAVMYTVKGSADAVVAHYKTELAAKGWTVENTANMAGTSMISAKKDNRTIAVSVAGASDGMVQVSVGLEM